MAESDTEKAEELYSFFKIVLVKETSLIIQTFKIEVVVLVTTIDESKHYVTNQYHPEH